MVIRHHPSGIYFLVALLVVMLLMVRLAPITPIITYAAVFISSSMLYLFLCRESLKRAGSTKHLVFSVLLLILIRISFVGMQPLGSDDAYRYVWDGRVEAAGINPYRFAPDDTALVSLRTQNLPSRVNHPDLKTLYFPLSEWVFYLGYEIGGEHVWGVQLIILLSEIITIIGLLALMRELGVSQWRALLYAANPLIILQFALDAHIDALGFPFLVFGLLFYVRKNLSLSLFLIGCSLLVKPTALVLLPVLMLDQHGLVNRAKVLAFPLAVMLIPFIPYSFGVNPFEALATFSKNWYFNGALFSLLLPAFPDNQTNRLWCLGILLAVLLILYASKRTFSEKIVISVLLLLLCSPVAHPWYMGWMIVLLPLAPITSGIVLAATASLPSITFVTYQLLGIWKDYPLVLILEYVPVVVLLWFDLRRSVDAGADKGKSDSAVSLALREKD